MEDQNGQVAWVDWMMKEANKVDNANKKYCADGDSRKAEEQFLERRKKK